MNTATQVSRPGLIARIFGTQETSVKMLHPKDDMHPGVTSTAKYVRTLQDMVGADASVLYAQAVLRPSLALAQGHALSLIQGLDVVVNEWHLANDLPGFDLGLRDMCDKLRKLAHSSKEVISIEMGEAISKKKRTVETLRICVRDSTTVKYVVLYASRTLILHNFGGHPAFNVINEFCETFEPVEKGYINHVSFADGKITTSRIENNDDGKIIDAFYPFIPGGATNLVDRYLASESSILNQYGIGGTGKSTLMRKIASRATERHVLLVDNPLLYRDPGLSSGLMSHIRDLCSNGEKPLVLFEEVDNYIGEKTEGNDFLVQLLSMSSGVIKLDIKVVLASNLKNTDKVLNVLKREGRSFGSVEFVKMSPEQGNAARAEMKLPPKEFTGDVTLAEAICEEVVSIGENRNRTGFTN